MLKGEGRYIAVDEHRTYYEFDQIRLIFEDGVLIGWYRP